MARELLHVHEEPCPRCHGKGYVLSRLLGPDPDKEVCPVCDGRGNLERKVYCGR